MSSPCACSSKTSKADEPALGKHVRPDQEQRRRSMKAVQPVSDRGLDPRRSSHDSSDDVEIATTKLARSDPTKLKLQTSSASNNSSRHRFRAILTSDRLLH